MVLDRGNSCCGQHYCYSTGIIAVVGSTGVIVQG